MAIREIHHLPDEVLRRKASRVVAIDRSVQRLISDMIETMQVAAGVGLAAPQVGVSLRVIVLQMPEEEPIVIVNPEIVKGSEEREVMEACLSVPGYSGQIKRFNSVTVKGLDRHGKRIRVKATGLMAQALQHEIDHLDGRLYVDRIENPENLSRVETPD
ncbi:MAG: peptide deformylase [Dehalococcoidales bacterium]|jgi:peptide deformylase